MSIFDNLTKTPEQHVRELDEQINAQIAIEENMALCLGSGGHIVFTEDVDGFISHLHVCPLKIVDGYYKFNI